MSAVDKGILGAAGATVVGLAGVAGAISYSHMAELARIHGEVGWRSHAFPVSVDGIEVVASLVLLAHRQAGTRAGWLPWAALVAGTAASVAANVAVGASDPVGRLVAGWPAVALLVAIKLLAGLLDARSGHVARNQDERGTADPVDRSRGPGGLVAESAGTTTRDTGPRTVARERTGTGRVAGDRGSAGDRSARVGVRSAGGPGPAGRRRGAGEPAQPRGRVAVRGAPGPQRPFGPSAAGGERG